MAAAVIVAHTPKRRPSRSVSQSKPPAPSMPAPLVPWQRVDRLEGLLREVLLTEEPNVAVVAVAEGTPASGYNALVTNGGIWRRIQDDLYDRIREALVK